MEAYRLGRRQINRGNMDKGEEASRFSPEIKESEHKRLFDASEKSKKGRVKRLSAVGSISREELTQKKKRREMAIHVIPGSQQRQQADRGREKDRLSLSKVASSTSNCNGNSSKKVKISIKLSDDPDGDYCSTIPRKLRTAVRNRNKESISSTISVSKKKISDVGRSFESFENDSAKGSKLSMAKGDAGCLNNINTNRFITKDEEEVAEILSSLAGIINERQSQTNDLSIAVATSNRRCWISSTGTKAIGEEPRECQLKQLVQRPENSVNSKSDYFPTNGQVNFPASTHLNGESDCLHSRVHSKVNHCLKQEEPSVQLETGIDTNYMRQPNNLGSPTPQVKQELSLLSKIPGLQLNLRNCDNDVGKYASWSGLDSNRSWTEITSYGSFDSKIPPWLDASLCTLQPAPLQNVLNEKGFNVNHMWKSRKRCATHLHICRLIQNLQTRKTIASNHNEVLNHDKGNAIPSILNGADSTCDIGALRKLANETTRFTPEQHKCLHQGTRSSLAPGCCSSKKQTFNFLSLSLEGEERKPDGPSTAKDELDDSRQNGCIPITCSQPALPLQFAASQCFPNTAFLREPPAASASPLKATSYEQRQSGKCQRDPCSSAKPQLEQHQQQQYYQSWAAHVAAQFRPPVPYISRSQYPSETLVLPYPSTAPASEPMGSKTPVTQQHRSLVAAPSLPHGRLQKRDNCSSSYDSSGRGFSSSSMRLQLLCKERL